MWFSLNRMALAVSNFVVLSNPADFMKDPSKNNGAFSGVQKMAEGYFASAYQVMLVIGICIFVLAGLAAALLFGILKNSTKVQENKAWLIRILAAVVIFALVLTVIGMFYEIGNTADITAAVTPVP